MAVNDCCWISCDEESRGDDLLFVGLRSDLTLIMHAFDFNSLVPGESPQRDLPFELQIQVQLEQSVLLCGLALRADVYCTYLDGYQSDAQCIAI